MQNLDNMGISAGALGLQFRFGTGGAASVHGISCQRSDIIQQIMFFGLDYLVDRVRSRRKLADVGRRTPRWALEQFRGICFMPADGADSSPAEAGSE
jgi:hypothetical protein